MSSLTQKLVSSRSMTLIGDISKDYPSVEAVKDLHVFSTVSLVRLICRAVIPHRLFPTGFEGAQSVSSL